MTTRPTWRPEDWVPPIKEAADLVFDTVDDEIRALKAEIRTLRNELESVEDLHRHEEDGLRIRIDEFRTDALEWKAIAKDLYLGCICQVADMEPEHNCNYRKARAAVLFWWKREAEKRG